MVIDYYDILKISPSANIAEIKTAYRKLALQYHPDKNPENEATHAYFELIKEAYETLSNSTKKENYLQERWLAKANGEAFKPRVTSPKDILIQVLNAGDKIKKMDMFRMNKDGVIAELNLLLSEENIKILHAFNEISINDAIVKELMQTMQTLPTADELLLLKRLNLINNNYHDSIENREEILSGNLFWETWKPAFIILLVVLICILIYGTSLRR